jgi:hypothetical protein
MFGEEENTPFDQKTTLERYKAEVLADQESMMPIQKCFSS